MLVKVMHFHIFVKNAMKFQLIFILQLMLYEYSSSVTSHVIVHMLDVFIIRQNLRLPVVWIVIGTQSTQKCLSHVDIHFFIAASPYSSSSIHNVSEGDILQSTKFYVYTFCS